jgi:hypothetical protein
VLAAQYQLHAWWQTAQRESIYDLFLLAAIAMQLVAQSPATRVSSRARALLLAGAGALTTLLWFGKPTYVVFSALGIAALAIDDVRAIDRRRGLVAIAIGSALACVLMLAFLATHASIADGARILGIEVPRLYRYLWKLSFSDMYAVWGNAPKLNYAFATMIAGAALVAARALPRRALLLMVPLVGGLASFFVQGKGFPYHLHPITAGTHLVWIGALACAVERAREGGRARVIAGAGALALALQCATEAWMSDARRSDWSAIGATADARASEAYVRAFPAIDYFAWDLRAGAAFVRAHTAEDARVQTYGMDPYVLFLARRLSATPYIYSFELNVDASLAGGSGGHPDDAERAWLVDHAKRDEADMLARLDRAPPAAFVFVDGAPFTRAPDAEADFDAHCPRASAWMRDRYRSAARFGKVSVWLRDR